MARPQNEETHAGWIKLDLHIHTCDDPKDVLDYSPHQLLARAHTLGFSVLAITLHDAVFDHAEVFAHAAELGILLIPSAEVRLRGADVVILNTTAAEIAALHSFEDLRALRRQRGDSIFTFAPHPFYVLGGSIGARLAEEIDCFDAIEFCHFYKGLFNPNRRAIEAASRHGKPLVATSDAHRLTAFGANYTSMPRPTELTADAVFAGLRAGPLRLRSEPASLREIAAAAYFIFIDHPFRKRYGRHAHAHARTSGAGDSRLLKPAALPAKVEQ